MSGLTKISQIINQAVAPSLLIISVVLYFQMRSLPDEISAAQLGTGTNVVTKTVTVNKTEASKAGLIYINGRITGKSTKMENQYAYNGNYPPELYDGFISTMKGENNTPFLLWSNIDLPIPEDGMTLRGWFMCVEGDWQISDDSTIAKLVFPAIQRIVK